MAKIRIEILADTVYPDHEILKMVQHEGLRDDDMLKVLSIKLSKEDK